MLEKLEKIQKKFRSLRLEHKIIVITLSLLVLWMLSGVLTEKERRNNSAQGQSKAPVFESKPSSAKLHDIRIRINGIIEACKIVELKAESSGYIEELVAEEGDVLEEGDVILILDSKNTLENLENAKFNVEKARVAYESSLALFEKGLGSELNYFQAKSDLTKANSDLVKAQMDFEDTKVKMPFKGVVDHIYVETGDLIETGGTAQDPVARVVCTSNYKVISYIPEPHINKVSIGQDAEVMITDADIIRGNVTSVSQVANETIKTFDAEILLEETHHALQTGTGVYVEIAVGQTKAHHIPLSAITLDDGGTLIIKYIENDAVKQREISFVDEDDEGLWITGIPDETEIVVMGASNIKAGTEVAEYRLDDTSQEDSDNSDNS